MAIQDTDNLLVSRGGTNHQMPIGNTMALQDTDLLLVSRDKANYTITGEELFSFTSGGRGRGWRLMNGGSSGLPVGTGFVQVAWHNGIYLGSGYGGTYRSLDDGLTWELCPVNASSTIIGTYSGGFLCFGGGGQTNTVYVYESADGLAWTFFDTMTAPAGQQQSTAGGTSITKSANETIYAAKFFATGISTSYPYTRLHTDSKTQIPFPAPTDNDKTYDVKAVLKTSKGHVLVGTHAQWVPVGGPTYTSILGTNNSFASYGYLGSVTGGNQGWGITVNDKFVTILNAAGAGNTTNAILIDDPTQPATHNIPVGLGSTAIRAGAWDSVHNTLTVVGDGGSIANSYDQGLTWKPCGTQFDIPDIGTQSLTGCATSGTSFIACSDKSVIRTRA